MILLLDYLETVINSSKIIVTLEGETIIFSFTLYYIYNNYLNMVKRIFNLAYILLKLILIFSFFLVKYYENEFNILLIKICKIPRLSVIIPIFNSDKYLSSCLNSVINQTLKNIEIICIDDGSKDESINIINNYSILDKRIIFISQKNKGSGISRNKGIKISKGKYISFIDSDDLYPNNNTLQLMYKKAIRNKAYICGGGLRYLQEKSNRIILSKPKFSFKKEGFINYYNYQFHFGYYRFIYNKNFLKKNKIFFPDYLRYQDPPFFIKAMIYSQNFYALKEITYIYRSSHKKIIWNEKKIIDELNALKECINYSIKYKLDILYCNVIRNINSKLFRVPIRSFIKNNKIIKEVSQILKNINYKQLNNSNCKFKINNIYKKIQIIFFLHYQKEK